MGRGSKDGRGTGREDYSAHEINTRYFFVPQEALWDSMARGGMKSGLKWTVGEGQGRQSRGGRGGGRDGNMIMRYDWRFNMSLLSL